MEREIWITGIGLVSSLGEGLDAHWHALAEVEQPSPVIDRDFAAPFAIHAMAPVNLDLQIPRRADQRQMEKWQRFGTYAAGLALTDAGIAGNAEILGRTHLVVAAGGGERDIPADSAILEQLSAASDPDAVLNERLGNDLRPTLFLAQLPNLLAGNISIVHNVTGSSRTFMGEEIAGVSAIEVARRRIAAGQGDIFLVGGATIAERREAVLHHALGGMLLAGEPGVVWERSERGGGAVLGSMGAFLVLEGRDHAEARGRRGYARLGPVVSGQTARRPGEAAAAATRQFADLAIEPGRPVAVISGATGIAPATEDERAFLAGLIAAGRVSTVRGAATILGSGIEANFPMLTGLAALALSRKGFYRPFAPNGFEGEAPAPDRIVVTCWGFWRGEGLGLVEALENPAVRQ